MPQKYELADVMEYDTWDKQTELGMFHPRRPATLAVGQALKEYHEKGESAASFIKLTEAFQNMKSAQAKAKGDWKRSDRNKAPFHALEVLNEQIQDVVRLAAPDYCEDERKALKKTIGCRSLVISPDLKANLDSAAHYVKHLVQYDPWNHRNNALLKGAVQNAIRQILGDVSSDELFRPLGFCSDYFAAAAGMIIGAADHPATFLREITERANHGAPRVDARVPIVLLNGRAQPWETIAKVNSIIQLIDRELLAPDEDRTPWVNTIVSDAFKGSKESPGVYAFVSCMVNLKLHARMANAIKAGNNAWQLNGPSLELFNPSPVLGCYFLILAEPSLWFNIHSNYGSQDWKETVRELYLWAPTVRKKARELIKASKYGLSDPVTGIWDPGPGVLRQGVGLLANVA
jgi:hypothetical protein